jgi:hypothetical protein
MDHLDKHCLLSMISFLPEPDRMKLSVTCGLFSRSIPKLSTARLAKFLKGGICGSECEIVDALVELRQENATLSRSAIERRIFRTVKAQLANALREAEERECPY